MYPVNPTKKAKITFSPSDVDHYERLLLLEHAVAMGYVSPAIPREKSMVERMNEAFPVPSPLHASFRRWIEHNQAARFDCFRPHLGFVHAINVSHISYNRRRMLPISSL